MAGDGAVVVRTTHDTSLPALVPPRGSVVVDRVVLAGRTPAGSKKVAVTSAAAGRGDFGERFPITLMDKR